MAKIDTSVGHLVDMIERGELRLPELQRRYVWPATRVRDLLDSLYRGYPSGTILVWETDQEVPSRDLVVQQTSSAFTPKLLLDGQQRLTSLSAVIRGEPIRLKGRVRPIHIAFNLDHPEGPPVEVMEVEDDEQPPAFEQVEEEGEEPAEAKSLQERLRSRTFVVGSNALFADPRWVRVSDIFKGEKTDWQLLKGLVDSPDDPKYDLYAKRLQRVRRIREYPYVMHVLERSLPYEEVAEIFVRVNSLGMKLRGSDLALAQITARWPNSLQMFEDFAEECEKVWFTFDTGLLVRTLVAFATKQSRFRTAATIPVPMLKESWEKAKDGLRFAVNFLRANAGIEDESLLSSPLLVIPVAVFAVLKNRQLTHAEERGLLYWLLMANAKGHFSGSAETTLDNDLRILFRGGTPSDLLDALRQQVGRTTFEPSDFVGRSPRNPMFPVVYLALKQGGAQDWQSGLNLSLTHSGKWHYINFHHIFPKSRLASEGYETSEINEIANMAFISGSLNRALSNKEPNEYFPGVIEKRGPEALYGQHIPLDPALWEVANYRAFLETRRSALARTLNGFFEGIAADRSVAADVHDLIEAGESGGLEFKSSARFNAHTGGADPKLEAVIAKTISGFMNADGGTLLIGVNDSGLPVGIQSDLDTLTRKDRDGYEQFLTNLVAKAIGVERCPDMAVSFHKVEDADICMVRVSPSPKPAYVTDGAERRLYVRTGNSTRPLTTEEAVAYVGERWR
ncbi:MAG: DUF262 domain-containing protein [Dehalococcoidia bacterium]|nr:DUF262 domain-containing protein [Dehalococcoidia bacterium]